MKKQRGRNSKIQDSRDGGPRLAVDMRARRGPINGCRAYLRPQSLKSTFFRRKCTLLKDANNVACRGVSERHLSQAMAMLTQYTTVMRLMEIWKNESFVKELVMLQSVHVNNRRVHRCRKALIRQRLINQSALHSPDCHGFLISRLLTIP